VSARGIDFKTGDIVAGKYLIKKELGRGGFGVVYQVEHQHIPGQRLALKILYPEVARDVARRNAFIREVQVGMRLVHPNIVIVRDAAATDELTFYTMDFVDGRPIDRILEDDGPPEVERALEWARQVCAALSLAHAERIVHRDIKPGNMLVTKSGAHEVVKVLDFGIAKLLEQSTGATLSDAGLTGTPEYLSPEQAQGKKSVDGRSDIYSLGAVLYHLLAGRLPFVSESLTGFIFQHSFESAPPFSVVAPHRVIPASAEAIVRKALEKEPEKRFQSADEMAAAISASLIEAATGVITASGGRVTSTSETGVASQPMVAAQRGIDWDKELEGQVIEKYRLTTILGKGGFGVVSAAEHMLMGRKVAIKLLRPDLGAEKSFLDRFRREAQVTASMQHPNLITIHDYGEVPGACFIVMEYIEGETLGDRLRARRFFPPAEAYEVLKPALEGIALAHTRGIVHRDLKPGNIMLTKDGRVKVLDFGIAKIVGGGGGPALTQTGAIIGSAHYISPEAVLGNPVDTRADLYSIGCILFEMLTGRVPFVRNNTIDYFKAHAKDAPPRLREVKPDATFPDVLERLVLRLLEKDPAKRPATIDELLPALEQACRAAAAKPATAARIPTPSDATVAHVGGYGAPEQYKTPSQAVGGGGDSVTISTPRPQPGLSETIAHGATGSHSGLRGGAAVAGAGAALGKMARLELADPPQTNWFLFATARLRFGRAKPGTQGSENELVLRLLPCDPRVSPDNWNRTSEISGQHGELVLQGGVPSILDKSSKGTWLDGRKLAKGQAERLPDTFRLGIANVLEMQGRVFPGGGRPAEAVRLTRVGNWDHDVYVWVIARAEVGPGQAIELPAGGGEVRNEGESLVTTFAAPMNGETSVGGVKVRVLPGGPAEQVDRKHPC
jgi:serine/threonine protein kinase